MLHATLAGRSVDLIDLAHPELRKELENQNSYSTSQEAREYKEDVGALLPWNRLWANAHLGCISADELGSAIADARTASTKAASSNYREDLYVSDEIARLWFDILVQVGGTQVACLDDFNRWIDSLKRPLYTSTLIQLARLAARRDDMVQLSLDYASKAFIFTRDNRADAEAKASTYVDLARVVLTVSESEAAAYFDEAVKVASKIGDENLDRWATILDLADRAANPAQVCGRDRL